MCRVVGIFVGKRVDDRNINTWVTSRIFKIGEGKRKKKEIDFAKWHIYVPEKIDPLPRDVRRDGISMKGDQESGGKNGLISFERRMD